MKPKHPEATPAVHGDHDAQEMLQRLVDYLLPDASARKNAARTLFADLRGLSNGTSVQIQDLEHSPWTLQMLFLKETSTSTHAHLRYDPDSARFTLTVGNDPSNVDVPLNYDPVAGRFVGKEAAKDPSGAERRLSGAATVIKQVLDTVALLRNSEASVRGMTAIIEEFAAGPNRRR